jgi:hypothetical protein
MIEAQNPDVGRAEEKFELSKSVGYVPNRVSTAPQAPREAALQPLGLHTTPYSCPGFLQHRPGRSNSAPARGGFVSRQSIAK